MLTIIFHTRQRLSNDIKVEKKEEKYLKNINNNKNNNHKIKLFPQKYNKSNLITTIAKIINKIK